MHFGLARQLPLSGYAADELGKLRDFERGLVEEGYGYVGPCEGRCAPDPRHEVFQELARASIFKIAQSGEDNVSHQ
jgi:hypothetical protein